MYYYSIIWMNHSFFPTSFLLMDSLYLIFACYVISVYPRMDVYAKIFFLQFIFTM